MRMEEKETGNGSKGGELISGTFGPKMKKVKRKTIHVGEELHARIKSAADSNKRKIVAELDNRFKKNYGKNNTRKKGRDKETA